MTTPAIPEEESLSAFWRRRRSTDRPVALRDLQEQLTFLARLVLNNPKATVTWHKDLVTEQGIPDEDVIVLDSSAIDDIPVGQAIPDSRVDMLYGDLIFRANLIKLQPKVPSALDQILQPWQTRSFNPDPYAQATAYATSERDKRIMSILKHWRAFAMSLNNPPAVREYIGAAKAMKRSKINDAIEELNYRCSLDDPAVEDVLDLWALCLIYDAPLSEDLNIDAIQTMLDANKEVFRLARGNPSSTMVIQSLKTVNALFSRFSNRPKPPPEPTPSPDSDEDEEDGEQGQDSQSQDQSGQSSPDGTDKENEGEEPEGGPGEDEDDENSQSEVPDDQDSGDSDSESGADDQDGEDNQDGSSSDSFSQDSADEERPGKSGQLPVSDNQSDDDQEADEAGSGADDSEPEEGSDSDRDSSDEADSSDEDSDSLDEDNPWEDDGEDDYEDEDDSDSPEDGDSERRAPNPLLDDKSSVLDRVDQLGQLSDEDAQQIKDAIEFAREDITDEVESLQGGGADTQRFIWQKAHYDKALENELRAKAYSQVAGLTQIFSRFKRLRSRTEHGTTDGFRLDSRRLARVMAGSDHVFQKKTIIDSLDMCMVLLLDASGSVSDPQFRIMQQVAAVFVQAFQGRTDVELMVESYYNGVEYGKDQYGRASYDNALYANFLIRHFDRRMGRMAAPRYGSGGTPSGEGLAAIRDAIFKRLGVRKKDKVIIHLTDGAPNDVSEVVRQVGLNTEAGIQTFCIYISSHLSPAMEAQLTVMYGREKWIHLQEYKMLLPQLIKLFGHIVEVK